MVAVRSWLTRRTLVLAGAALAVSACAPESRLDPDAAVVLTGQVLNPGGSVAADRPVTLVRESTLGDALVGLPFVLATVGLICLSEDAPSPCGGEGGEQAGSGPDGGFRFELEGRDTQGFLGGAKELSISTSGAAGAEELDGPAVSARFRVQEAQLDIGALRQWQPDVTLGRGGATIDYTYRSPRLPYAGAYGAPPSRGKTCSVSRDGGEAVPQFPCPLTDGDLTTTVAFPPSPSTSAPPARSDGSTYDRPVPLPDSVVIDLDQASPVTLAVVPGCTGACPVAVSADGVSWSTVGDASGRFAVLPVSGAPMRYLRVTSSFLSDLHEVSV